MNDYALTAYDKADGDKVKAIKLLRKKYDISLKEARAIINDAERRYCEIVEDEYLVDQDDEDEDEDKDYVIDDPTDRTIKNTIIIDTDSRIKVGSALTRGVAGGLLLGPIGIGAGIATSKFKKTTTFQINYRNGRSKIETVKNGSAKYKEYCKYL